MPTPHVRYGVCKLEGWLDDMSSMYHVSWYVYDRHRAGAVVARFNSAWNRNLRRWSTQMGNLPPDVARRQAKLHARKLNVEQRHWEDAVDLEEISL